MWMYMHSALVDADKQFSKVGVQIRIHRRLRKSSPGQYTTNITLEYHCTLFLFGKDIGTFLAMR